MRFKSEADEKTFESKISSLSSANLIKVEGETAYLSVDDKDLNAFISLLSDLDPVAFSNRRESLEDYFMKFYKEDKDFGGALK